MGRLRAEKKHNHNQILAGWIMARPRTPAAKADATGAAGKNPQRFRDRK